MVRSVAAEAARAGEARDRLVDTSDGGIVLDPFGGAGTTALVANRLGRTAILSEINPNYAKMAYDRLIANSIDPDAITLIATADQGVDECKAGRKENIVNGALITPITT